MLRAQPVLPVAALDLDNPAVEPDRHGSPSERGALDAVETLVEAGGPVDPDEALADLDAGARRRRAP